MQLIRLSSFYDDDVKTPAYVVRKSKGWVFDPEGNICFNSGRLSSGYIKNGLSFPTQEDGFLRVNGRQHTLVKDERPDSGCALLAVATDGHIRVEERFEFFRIFNQSWGNLIILKIKVGQEFDVKITRKDATTQNLVVNLRGDGVLDVIDISELEESESRWRSFCRFVVDVARDYFQFWKGWRKK